MKLSEFNRLKKLMMLTTSDNDAEALSALRKANGVLKDHGYDWNGVFGKLVRVEVGVEAAPADDERRAVDVALQEKFDEIFGAKKDNEFIGSLHEQFEKTGRLSPAQREAVMRWRV